MNQTTTSHPSTKLAVIFAWLFVGVPTAWGVYNSVKQATLLFKSPDKPAATSVQVR